MLFIYFIWNYLFSLTSLWLGQQFSASIGYLYPRIRAIVCSNTLQRKLNRARNLRKTYGHIESPLYKIQIFAIPIGLMVSIMDKTLTTTSIYVNNIVWCILNDKITRNRAKKRNGHSVSPNSWWSQWVSNKKKTGFCVLHRSDVVYHWQNINCYT